MRCPYCGRANLGIAKYCVSCGRDVSVQIPPNQRPTSSASQPSQVSQSSPSQPTRPTQWPPTPPAQRPSATPPAPPKAPPVSRQYIATTVPDLSVQAVSALKSPVPFPPKTMAQLQDLEQEALPYALINDTASYGKKRIVRILYQRCASWQQVATLLKAFKEYNEQKFDTIVIQGVLDKETDFYQYTNGQLVFNRAVRLGSQTIDRYQIETGNGYTNDSVRIVLSDS